MTTQQFSHTSHVIMLNETFLECENTNVLKDFYF